MRRLFPTAMKGKLFTLGLFPMMKFRIETLHSCEVEMEGGLLSNSTDLSPLRFFDLSPHLIEIHLLSGGSGS